MHRFVGILGILFVLALAYVMSNNRGAIRYKIIAWGLGLQIVLAFVVMRWTVGQYVFAKLGHGAEWLLDFSYYGSSFVFGELGMKNSPRGFIFAFQALPIIIFIAAFFALLYYWGVMQVIVKAAAKIMTRLMGASGAESLNVAASIFMGQTEAPLTIRPFLPEVTQSELMTIMTSGMAHVSGSLMGAYMAYGIHAEHLLAAVIMTAPGTIMIAKMIVPETQQPLTAGRVEMAETEKDANAIGAIARGTVDGLHLALNVAAMLVSFIALVYLVDALFGGAHNLLAAHGMGRFPSSLEQIFGWVFAPIAWLAGVSWHDASAVGNLMGLRMVTNELVAFQRLGPMQATLDPRSFTIATFALCGFANFSSIGIQIGGIGALAPNKRSDLARLGIRAMLAGTMANLLSASLVGIMLR
jgi:concentrative nucleoside transporter, CNT family